MIALAAIAVTACDVAAPRRTDAWPPADTVVAELVTVVGEIEGPAEYLFGEVVSVAVDDRGTLYVADGLATIVRAYDATSGAYLGDVGSEGDGPGEFRFLRDLSLAPDDELWIRDAYRLSVFRRTAAGTFADSLVRTIALGGLGTPFDVRGKTDGRRYFRPGYLYQGFMRRGYFYTVLDSTGPTGDTVHVPPFPDPEFSGRANYPVDEGLGRAVDGINRAPFEPAPSWDIGSDGHVFFSLGDVYEVVEVTAQGDTLAVVQRPSGPTPVPARERRDSSRAFLERLDSVPVPLDLVRGMSPRARSGEIPEQLPQIVSVRVDPQARLWLRRWPGEGRDESLFDVLDGERAHTVRLPVRVRSIPPPWIGGGVVAAVVEDAVTGVERVAVYRVELPGAGEAVPGGARGVR